MLQALYQNLNQSIFTIDKIPDPVIEIDNISLYNEQEGLALSVDEIQYLDSVVVVLNRKLTDRPRQVNSEHCRHKIFNGTFIIDGEEKESSLFQLIKLTTKTNPNGVFLPTRTIVLSSRDLKLSSLLQEDRIYLSILRNRFESVLSLKAKRTISQLQWNHLSGASTGSGGEIRDRIGGGKAGIPIAGTAVYMTSYPRTGRSKDMGKGNRRTSLALSNTGGDFY